MIEKQKIKKSSYFQLSFVDKLISQKLKGNQDEPVYNKFQDSQIRIYRNSLLKLIFAPFITFSLTYGCFSIWNQIKKRPGSIIAKLTRILRLQRGTNPNFVTNPYTQLAKDNKQANFNRMQAKFAQDSIYQSKEKRIKEKMSKMNLQQDPRSIRYKNYKLQGNQRTRGSGDLRKQLLAIGFLKSRKVNAQPQGDQLIMAQRRAAQREFQKQKTSFVGTYIPKIQRPTVLTQSEEIKASQQLKKNSKFFNWFIQKSRLKRDEFQNKNDQRQQSKKFFRRGWIFVPSLVIFIIFLYQHIALAGALYLKYIPYVDTYYILKQAENQNRNIQVAKTLINVEDNHLR